jgi:transposase-like protein
MQMSKNLFAAKHFHDEEAARAWFEKARWPEGRVCPSCGSLKSYETKKPGRHRCGEKECRRDFTVMTSTVMERSHAKLTQWAMAFYLASSSKKGFSAHQLHRALGCQYSTAWFLHHRVMEAMRRGDLDLPPLGGKGKIVEADETYYGSIKETRAVRTSGKPYLKRVEKARAKRAIITLVERGGEVRSFHVPRADKVTVSKIVADYIARESRLHTDESNLYKGADQFFTAHETVKHSAKEYARGDVHVNSAEGYFGIFKRGMRGVYQHCAEKNLHRYLAEFDFRYNTRGMSDVERTLIAIKGGEGKRLTYRLPH